MMQTIYFDYNATTPLDAEVREAMLPFLGEVWGNPSSVHHVGRRARSLLDDARERAARILDCKASEVVFTGGGTESINLAIFGTARLLRPKGRHIVTSAIEHHAVLRSFDYLARKEGFELTRLPVDRQGLVSPDMLKRALRADTILVSIMAANNEIGTVQPVGELGAICRDHGVKFHTDTVQWLGKEPFTGVHQFNADLVSICAHKMHGPKGVGAVFVKSPLQPDPLLFGGTHENERRAGTENLAGIIGLVEALERFVSEPVFPKSRLLALTGRLAGLLDRLEGVQTISPRQQRLANTVSFVVEGADNAALLAGLDLEGICASGGSACSAGSPEPSHVVRALGLEERLAYSLVRFSLGRETTAAEVEQVEGVLPQIISRAQGSGQRASLPVFSR
jgi:cysteine desulfurase